MIASYTKNIDGIELKPFKFVGHGWMYAYGGSDSSELEKLKASKEAFEIPDAPQKKNPSSVIFRSGSSETGNKPPPRKRSCCGGR